MGEGEDKREQPVNNLLTFMFYDINKDIYFSRVRFYLCETSQT